MCAERAGILHGAAEGFRRVVGDADADEDDGEGLLRLRVRSRAFCAMSLAS